MEIVVFDRLNELEKNRTLLEKKLNVKISLKEKNAVIEGEAMDEYGARLVLEAVSFGFSVKKALMLKEPDIMFKIIKTRQHTRRKNLKDIIARIIGAKGQTKQTIQQISGCYLVVKGSEVGVLGVSENVDEVSNAIIRLIAGAKQANVYAFLERMNRMRKLRGGDLGLKPERK